VQRFPLPPSDTRDHLETEIEVELACQGRQRHEGRRRLDDPGVQQRMAERLQDVSRDILEDVG